MSPQLTAFAYGCVAFAGLVMVLMVWAGWASREMVDSEDRE
jgi:hypothetical protein